MTIFENFVGAQVYVGLWAMLAAIVIGILISAVRGRM